MTNILKSILASILIFVAFYLLGCFVETSFNISVWSKETRVLIVIFGGIFSLTAFTATLMFFSEND